MTLFEEVRKHVKDWELVEDNELRGLCPFHEEEEPSFWFNIDKGLFYCFGCGAKGHATQFFTRIFNDRLKAMKLVRALDIANDITLLKTKEFKQTTKVSLSDIPADTGECSYLASRGFTLATKEKWDVRCNVERMSYIFPVQDFRGDYVGWVERKLLGRPKYKYSDGFAKSLVLYGHHEVMKQKEQYSPIFVTEGVLDCLWLWQNGFMSVAVLGVPMSDTQRKQLRGYDCRIVFDGDSSGRRAAKAASTQLGCRSIELTDGKDIQDYSSDELPVVLNQ